MHPPKYPCCVCSGSCADNAIECSICFGWVHFQCVPLSGAMLDRWIDSDFDFACKNCIFQRTDDGQQVFDFKQGLQSIKSCDGNIKQQHQKAMEIQLLLETYNVGLPSPTERFTGQTDTTAANILRIYHPATLKKYTPLKTIGDGNCLYRAVSRMLYGKETHHTELRLRSTIEILQNREHYDMDCETYVNQIKDDVVVTSNYSALVNAACTYGAYSELLHMYALSAASGTILYSFFPPTDPCGFYSKAFSRKVIGRCSKPSIHGPPLIMWTQTYIPSKGRDFVPNHFVPLFCNLLKTDNNELDQDNSSDTAENRKGKSIFSKKPMIVDYNEENEMNHDGDDDHEERDNSSLTEVEEVEDSPLCKIEGPSMGVLTASRFLSTAEVINLLTNSEQCIENIPQGHKNNVYFIINNINNSNRQEKNKQRQFWDDCGAWTGIKGSSPKQYFLCENSKLISMVLRNEQFCREKQVNKKRVFVPLTPPPSNDSILIIRRLYNTHKSSSKYKRRITWVEKFQSNVQSKLKDIAVVEYLGEFPGRTVHGNAKKSQTYQYKRTLPSVLHTIANLTEKMNPRNAYDKMHHEAQNDLELPRSLEQVRNKKKNNTATNKDHPARNGGNFADNFISLSAMAQTHPFIQKVINTKSKVPSIVCYIEEQVKDLKRFCAKPNGTVLGFDKTFNLGDLYVTTSVFKHMAVECRDTESHPIFPGPVFLHGNFDYETYNDFFAKLSTFFSDEEHSHLVFGTDDEQALRKAVKRNFPSATSVVCTRHLKNNVKDFLIKNVPSDVSLRNAIIQRIFGTNGITDAEDDDVLAYRVQTAVSLWEQQAPGFVQYFTKRLLPILSQNVCIPQQVHKINKDWTNNNCESINYVLKIKTDWKQLKLTDLVLKIYEFVDAKYKDLRRALSNEGSFYLCNEFKHHEVNTDVWYLKTKEGRTKAFEKFLTDQGKKATNRVTTTDGKFTVPVKSSKSKKLNQIKRSRAEKTNSAKRRRLVD